MHACKVWGNLTLSRYKTETGNESGYLSGSLERRGDLVAVEVSFTQLFIKKYISI